MELTSTSFLVTLIVVTVLAMLALLLLWNRIPEPGWLRWPARVLMIGLCQLTAICVVAASINGGYGLYASWDDLLGTDTGPASAMTGPPPGRARFTQGGDGTQSVYFRGSRSKLAGQVTVWTPRSTGPRARSGPGSRCWCCCTGTRARPGPGSTWATCRARWTGWCGRARPTRSSW